MKQSQFINEIHAAILAIIKQGKPCAVSSRVDSDATACSYSDDKGNNCIVGKLFTPAEITKYGNYKGSVAGLLTQGWRRGVYTPMQRDTLTNLQLCHDGYVRHSLSKKYIPFAEYFINMAKERYILTDKQHAAYMYIAKLPASELENITSYKEVPPYSA